MTAPVERHIRLQGSYNFRDVGGYAAANGQIVRWRRLYRSDALHRLSDDDLTTLRPIGVSTLLDLRTLREVEESGQSQLIAAHGATHRHVPFIQDLDEHLDENMPVSMDDLYVAMLEHGANALQGVFLALADAETYPAVVHCAAGKDRTGMTVALVLRTLGVADADIALDYTLTHGYYEEYTTYLQSLGRGPLFEGFPPELMIATPELILGLLRVVDDRFGSSEQFLRDCGVPEDAFGEIRSLLLDAPSPGAH